MEPQPIQVYTAIEDYLGFFFKSALGRVAILLLLISWIVYENRLSKGDWGSFRFAFREVAITNGIINSSELLDLQINGKFVNRTYFTYEVAGVLHYGDAYIHGNLLENGLSVEVEYLVNQPFVSRIKGTRNAPYGPLIFFWAFIPLLGLTLFLMAVIRVVRMARLLNYGFLTKGIRQKQGVLEKNSFSPLRKIRYVYQCGNSSQVYEKRTTQSINYREKETIIFIDKPSDAMLCKDFSKDIIEQIERIHGVSLAE